MSGPTCPTSTSVMARTTHWSADRTKARLVPTVPAISLLFLPGMPCARPSLFRFLGDDAAARADVFR
eukprot:6205564-Prymnesium_polylepis.1